VPSEVTVTTVKNTIYHIGRFLQVVGLTVVLVGVALSIDVGLREKESLHSMAVEFRYLAAGGAAFAAGYLLCRISARAS
jgi:hypothetical protein